MRNRNISIEKIEEIEKLIRSGEHQKASELIEVFHKRLKFTIFDKVLLSEWWWRLGKFKKAIKVIGKEKTANEIKTSGTPEVARHLRLCFMFNFLGARISVNRILNNLNLIGNFHPDDSYIEYYMEAANINLANYRFKEALPLYEKAIEVFKDKLVYKSYLCKIGKADCLEALGESQQAIDELSDLLEIVPSEKTILRGIIHQAKAEYLFRINKRDEANQEIKAAKELINPQVSSHDYAFLMKWQGALEILKGNKKNAEKSLNLAWKSLFKDQYKVDTLIEVDYWLNQIEELPLDRLIPLRCYFQKNPYSALHGLKGHPKQKLHFWIKSQLKETNEFDSLLISDKLEQVNYCDVDLDNVLDLTSSIVFNNSKPETILKESESKILLYIISSGIYGVHQYTLIDYLYENSFANISSAEQRLDKEIAKLIKKGFKIDRKNSRYFFDFTKDIQIIIPANLIPQQIIPFAKRNLNEFKRQDVEQLLDINKHKAVRLINQWLEEGILNSVGKGKVQTYSWS